MKTTLRIQSGEYELEFVGCIHVTKGGRYWGAIEFDGGFGKRKQSWQDSAIANACGDLEAVTDEDRKAVAAAIKTIMPVDEVPQELVLSAGDVGMIYVALMAAAATSRDHGHTQQADGFHRIGMIFDAIRMKDRDYRLEELQGL